MSARLKIAFSHQLCTALYPDWRRWNSFRSMALRLPTTTLSVHTRQVAAILEISTFGVHQFFPIRIVAKWRGRPPTVLWAPNAATGCKGRWILIRSANHHSPDRAFTIDAPLEISRASRWGRADLHRSVPKTQTRTLICRLSGKSVNLS